MPEEFCQILLQALEGVEANYEDIMYFQLQCRCMVIIDSLIAKLIRIYLNEYTTETNLFYSRYFHQWYKL
jgi:hypothetical protein